MTITAIEILEIFRDTIQTAIARSRTDFTVEPLISEDGARKVIQCACGGTRPWRGGDDAKINGWSLADRGWRCPAHRDPPPRLKTVLVLRSTPFCGKGGNRARFAARKAGWAYTPMPVKRPWVAQIVGRDPTYGLARQFLTGQPDYLDGNRAGTRVPFYFWLEEGSVYELQAYLSTEREQRCFVHVVNGGIVKVSRADMLAMLDGGS